MSEHPDWCTKIDDPLAVSLWRSPQPAALSVWCAEQRHRLAKVYKIQGRDVLCLPAFKAKSGYFEMGTKDHGNGEAHFHAWQEDLDMFVEVEADVVSAARSSSY